MSGYQLTPDDRLALLRAEHAGLLTACRAAVVAARDGRGDPLIFVREQLAARGQLPGADVSLSQLLASARDVLALVDALTLMGVK